MTKKWTIFCIVLLASLALNSCRSSNGASRVNPSKVARTGQSACYDDSGAVISCATTTGKGQDGALQVGVVWPNPRFIDNGDQTITDNLTNLIWSQDGAAELATCGTGTNKTWQSALDYIACLNANNYLGHNDWRLPNINELYSLANFSQPSPQTWLTSQGFINVQIAYWSSTSASFPSLTAPEVNSGAKVVGMDLFQVGSTQKTYSFSAWPVRGGLPAKLPKTGQTNCYDSDGAVISCATTTGQGQDGALQMGVAWPSPRFTDNGNQTITDNLTNLIWAQDAWAYLPACATSGWNWGVALDYVGCMNSNNYLGYNDWRLPNVNELYSLINYGEYIHSTWLAAQGFVNVQFSDHYYTNTSDPNDPSCDSNVLIDLGYVIRRPKTEGYTVWLVRGGR